MEARVTTASVSSPKWSPAPEASEVVKSIHAMLHPRNIVLVGATDKPGNYAERIWNNLVKYKFDGGLYPVNARRETIWGLTCYKDFASLPEKPVTCWCWCRRVSRSRLSATPLQAARARRPS